MLRLILFVIGLIIACLLLDNYDAIDAAIHHWLAVRS
jgi:hypothetical protein